MDIINVTWRTKSVISLDRSLNAPDLGGCIVAIVYSEYQNGEKEGLMTHYPLFLSEEHEIDLQKRLETFDTSSRYSALFYKRNGSEIALEELLKRHTKNVKKILYSGYEKQVLFDVKSGEWKLSHNNGLVIAQGLIKKPNPS